MYAIGVTNAVDMTEVRGISSQPRIQNQNFWLVDDFSTLNAAAQDIASVVCGTSTDSGTTVIEGLIYQ